MNFHERCKHQPGEARGPSICAVKAAKGSLELTGFVIRLGVADNNAGRLDVCPLRADIGRACRARGAIGKVRREAVDANPMGLDRRPLL